jgi:hypothetical protein
MKELSSLDWVAFYKEEPKDLVSIRILGDFSEDRSTFFFFLDKDSYTGSVCLFFRQGLTMYPRLTSEF